MSKNVSIILSTFNEKSSTKLIVEKYNNTVNDLYFESNKKHDNFSLKEDITSFLSLLKKS